MSPPVRVFHCDDSFAFRILVREMLNDFGDVEVVGEADNLGQALTRLPAASADVVLVDLFEQDRPETLLPRLREASQGARLLLYTGMPEARVPDGADGHIHKSVPFDELHGVILQAAGRS